MNWEKLFKRYIWDDERTPYFVPAARMTRKQADYEIFAYAIFLGSLFTVLCLVVLSPAARSEGALLYLFTVIVATIVLGMTKHLYAAYYTGAAPLVLMAYLLLYGFPADLAAIDHFVLIVFALVWLRYAFRVAGIAKAYPDMPDDRPDGAA